MISEGVKLLVLGMGVVFIFLVLISLTIVFLGRLCQSQTRTEEANQVKTPKISSINGQSKRGINQRKDQDVIVAVIGAAISKYRELHH